MSSENKKSTEGKGPLEKFQRSVEAILCVERLEKLDVGEMVPYDDINGFVGLDIRGKRNAYQTAFRVLLTEQNKRFVVERGRGIRRLNQSEVIDYAQSGRQKAHKAIKRENKKLILGVPDVGELQPEDRQRYNIHRSVLEMLVATSSTKATKKVQAITAETSNMLPIQRTIEALKDL